MFGVSNPLITTFAAEPAAFAVAVVKMQGDTKFYSSSYEFNPCAVSPAKNNVQVRRFGRSGI
jgi:hypothetical protein